MNPARGSTPRVIAPVLIALLLALRLLTPDGFMPSFDHGALTIVACPDEAPASSMPAHHDGHPGKDHQPCPYGAAGALGSLAPGEPAMVAAPSVAIGVALGRAFLFIEKDKVHRRPFATGPPNAA